MFEGGITRRMTDLDTPGADLEDLKDRLKIDTDDEDGYLTARLISATAWAEQWLNRSLMETQWIRQFDADKQRGGLRLETKMFRYAYLPYSPLKTVDRVYSVDSYGNERDITKYYVDKNSLPERLVLQDTIGGRDIARLVIEYTSGYDEVPKLIQEGILQHAAYMAEHRGDCGAAEAARLSGATDTYSMYRVGVV